MTRPALRPSGASEDEGLCFIHPFDDPEVIAGQGTVGMEILRQCQEPPDAIYVAIGGGGLIGGIAAYVKSLWPNVEVIGVEPHDAAAMTLSLEAGERIRLPQVGLLPMALRCEKWRTPSAGPALCGFNRHGEHGRNLCSDQRRVRRHAFHP